MDRINDYGSLDGGSNPLGVTMLELEWKRTGKKFILSNHAYDGKEARIEPLRICCGEIMEVYKDYTKCSKCGDVRSW
jgi:hypothetical protein